MGAVETSSSGRARWPLILGTLAGLALLVWFLWNLHWGELLRLLSTMSWTWLGVSAALMIVDYGFHALRWWILIRQVDPNTPLPLVISATAIGTGMNTLLPFRAGAFVRPGIVAARRNLSYATILATTLAEAICDLFGVVGILLWMVWYLPASEPGSALEKVRTAGSVAVVFSVGVFVALALMRSPRAIVFLQRMTGRLPASIADRAFGWVAQFATGVEVLAHPQRLAAALLVTVGVWVSWVLALLATFKALGLELPVAAAVLLEAVLAVEMMVPQAPGFIGGFQHFTVITLAIFDVVGAPAEAVALVFWAVCFVPVTVWGVIEGWMQGFGLLTTQKDVAEAMQ
ncbi:MAG: flippase-like domain-containing protein [Deltaproteobacteria bacterium]|nr:flippase-like domain-containing protein [Deltaproteobacteria bacterium]